MLPLTLNVIHCVLQSQRQAYVVRHRLIPRASLEPASQRDWLKWWLRRNKRKQKVKEKKERDDIADQADDELSYAPNPN